MSNEELKTKIEKFLENQDVFIIKSVKHVNSKPHPYVIGTRHVNFAADNWHGMLSADCIRDGEKRRLVHCYFKTSGYHYCDLPYDEHTSERVIFLQLKRHVSNKEAAHILSEIKDEIKDEGIAGFAFIETPEKFRIEPPEKKVDETVPGV